MKFGVLGPLEVWDGDRTLQLGGSKRRALLALLILNANEVLRTERLAEDLWGENSPRNAIGSIHNHVSRLRKALGPDVLITHRWGYVLRVDSADIDLLRFERTLSEAEALPAAQRAARVGEALSLWRGPPLADLALEPSLATSIARLEERRLVALEQRIDADLETGRDAELVGELEELIEENPLREHFRWQLILALYRSGRQAEALEVYRETRRLLVEELGLEPGPELRALEGAILRHDPALAPPVVAPAAGVPERTRRARRRVYATVAAILASAGIAAGAYVLATQRTSADDSSAQAAAVQAAPHPGTRSNARKPRVHVHISRSPRVPPSTSSPAPAIAEPAKTQPKPTAQPKPATPSRPSTGSTTPSTTTPNTQPPTLANRAAWWTGVNQRQLSVTPEGDQVTINIPGNATDGFNASLGTRCKVVGDFDAQVSFRLMQWSGADGIWVSLMAGDLGGVNAYRSDSFGEVYGAYIPPSGGTTVPATDSNGVLRLVRRGAKISGSYRVGNNWVTIFDGNGPTVNTAINLSVFNLPDVAPFAGRPATVRFNAFTLAATALAC
jgi:DNA-binding SARP family transcriptional activator